MREEGKAIIGPSTRRPRLRDAYLAAVGLDGDQAEKRLRALELAHDLRKFEIELLWKRSAYLWGFQVVSFAGFSALFLKATDNLGGDISDSAAISVGLLQLIVAFFGLACAFLWYATASASRIWFYNWEKHIDFLEAEFTGDIYKTLYFRQTGPIYSLSGVNVAITLAATLFWAFSTLVSLILLLIAMQMKLGEAIPLSVLFAVLILCLAALVKGAVKSGGPHRMSVVDGLRLREGHFKQRHLDWPTEEE